jgi:predicted lipoprotein with Yx(FWY)xxD motif
MMTDRFTRTRTPGRGHPRTGRWRRMLAATSLGTLVVVVVAGAAGTGVAAAGTPTVQVATNAMFGIILTTDSGMALYTLTTDHNGQSTCHGSCAAAWPALTVPAGTVPTGGPGVTGTVGTSEQSNGTFQVTYNGAPLYTFVGDASPGQVNGNNVADFFVVTVAPATTTTTTEPGAPPPNGAPAAGTAPPTATSSTPTPTPASTGPAPSTASSAKTAPGVTSASEGALAFTGTGPGLTWLLALGVLLVGLGLVVLGAVRAVGTARTSKAET